MEALTLAKRLFFFAPIIFTATISSPSSQENPVMLFKIAELKNGMKFRYTLSLPRQSSQTESCPLVVALHYGGKVTPFYSKDFMTSLVQPALQDLEAIIAAPDCPAMGWTNAASEAVVLELILILMEEYNIDATRILLVGYSMGGLGTWYMAARHPDLFSAAIPISAPAEIATTPVIETVPMYVIHGEKDEICPVSEAKKLYEKQMDGGAEIKLAIVADAGHYEISRFVIPLKSAIPWINTIWDNR
jgi:predicted peptidase